MGAGEFFGEIALIEGHSHNSTAVTTQTTSLLELRWTTLESIMEANPKLLQNLNKALADRLRKTDQRLIKALAQLAEENIKLYSRIAAALSVSKEVGDMLDWSELWQRLLDKSLVTLNAERGTVYVLNPTTNSLEGMVIRGEGLSKIVLKKGQGIAGASSITGEAIFVADAQQDNRFFPEFDAVTGFSTRAVICSPFRDNDGKVLGVIQLINSTPDSFAEDDLALLALFADQLALGYERANSVKCIVGQAEGNIAGEVINSVKEAIPISAEGGQGEVIERLFKRIDLAHRNEIVLSAKPVRFKTFLERLVQEVCSHNSQIDITIDREKLYEGFVTADPELLSAIIEGLILDLSKNQDQPIIISGVDQGESLNISISEGSLQLSSATRQPISFQAAQKLATFCGGSFKASAYNEGKFTVTITLPLAG